MAGARVALSGLLAAAVATVAADVTASSQTAALTPVQQRVFASNAARAASSSSRAHDSVVAMLDSPAFRALWRERCPPLADAGGEELLKRYREALDVTEIAHGFPAQDNPNQNNALDMSIDMMLLNSTTYFYNQWQMPLLFPKREFRSYYELVGYLAPAGAAEPAIWGFPPFTGGGSLGRVLGSGFPAGIEEANDRFVYTVANQHRVDNPVYLWGNVGVVFNNAYVRNSSLIEPTDTGDYVCACNRTFTSTFCSQWNQTSCKRFWFCHWDGSDGGGVCAGGERGAEYQHNCSAWPGLPSGTFGHTDHLLAPYAYWYNESDRAALDRVATLLGRMLVRDGLNVTAPHFDYYYEAEIFGRLEFPTAVNFLIADVGTLFGTALGGKVRAWATRWGWPLVWSPGIYARPTPPDWPPASFSGRERIVDPESLRHSRAGGNVSRSSVAAGEAAFDAQWAAAVALRAATGADPTTQNVTAWWRALVSGAAGGFKTESLYPGDCAGGSRCVGLLKVGGCLCYPDAASRSPPSPSSAASSASSSPPPLPGVAGGVEV